MLSLLVFTLDRPLHQNFKLAYVILETAEILQMLRSKF